MGDIEPQLVFVTGPGRSGTTLLQHLLASLPGADGLPETGLARWVVDAPSDKATTWDELKSVIPRSERLSLVAGPAFAHGAVGEIGDKSRVDAYLHLVRGFYGSRNGEVNLINDEQCSVIVDKDPMLSLVPRKLRRAFPNARIFFILRDPRDVMASRQKAGWSANQGFLRSFVAVAFQTAIAGRAVKFGAADGFVRYEDLVTSADDSLRLLCPDLVSPGWNVSSRSEAPTDLIASDEADWKSRALEAVSPSSIGSGERALTEWQTAVVQAGCREFMLDFEYEKRPTRATVSFFASLVGWPIRAATRIAAVTRG